MMLENTLPKQDYSATEIAKIRQLIWSNSIENDMLVLELFRNYSLPQSLVSDFIAVAITSEYERVKLAYKDYLKKHLTWSEYHEISNINFYGAHSNLFYLVKETFSADTITYTYFKRTGNGVDNFLQHSQKASNYRKEIFEYYLDRKKKDLLARHNYKHLTASYLSTQELATLFEDEAIFNTLIHRISITNCTIKKLPAALFVLQGVQQLELTNIALKEFPKRVFQLNKLKKLSFTEMCFGVLPKDWSKLQEIETLSFPNSRIEIEDFDFVATMPKLTQLDIGNSHLPSPFLLCTKKTLPLVSLNGFSSISKYPLKKLLTFASAISRSSLNFKDQNFYFNTVRRLKKISDFPCLTLHQLLQLLNINYAPLKEICLNRLESLSIRMDGIASLRKAAVVHIIGTTTMKKTTISNKLKGLAIDYSPKFSEKVTHILIGKNPKNFEGTINDSIKIITENQLQKFFSENQPQYLEQAAQSSAQPAVQDNLVALLRSPDATSAMLALEMLKSGGVPPDLIEALLVTQKTNTNSKVRTAAKKLLELYAPAEWLPLIRDKQHFAMIGKEVREQDLNNKLKKIAQKASKELAAMLSLALFKAHRKGLRYILYHFIDPHPNRTKAFQALMNGTHCDYRAGLGFRNLKDRTPDTIHLFKMKTAAVFPVDILTVIDKVESIDFHNCKFDKLYQSIGKFTALKQLNCSCNMLKKLPKTIRHLKKLETLDLSNNVFKEFPMEVLTLPNLKKLDLRYMHDYQNNRFHKLEIPAAIKIQLPDCEVLI